MTNNDKQREAFEQFLRTQRYSAKLNRWGDYMNPVADSMWETWQACAQQHEAENERIASIAFKAGFAMTGEGFNSEYGVSEEDFDRSLKGFIGSLKEQSE